MLQKNHDRPPTKRPKINNLPITCKTRSYQASVVLAGYSTPEEVECQEQPRHALAHPLCFWGCQRRNRRPYPLLFTGLASLATMSAFGHTANDPWLILASGERGSINMHTKREETCRCGAPFLPQTTSLFPTSAATITSHPGKLPIKQSYVRFFLGIYSRSLFHNPHTIEFA